MKRLIFLLTVLISSISYSQNPSMRFFHATNIAAPPTFDANVNQYIDSVRSKGGTINSADSGYVYTLVTALKAHGTWVLCQRIGIGLGGTAASAGVDLKDPTKNITWSGSGTTYSAGVQWGSSAYGTTSWNPSTAPSSSGHLHISYYAQTGSTTSGNMSMDIDDGTNFLALQYAYTGSVSKGLFGTLTLTGGNTSAGGLLLMTTNSTNVKLFFNASSTATGAAAGSMPNSNLVLGARYLIGCCAVSNETNPMMFYSTGNEFSDAQVTSFTTDVTAFLTSKGIN